MAAGPQVVGPCFIYTSGLSGQPAFLGTCEVTPKIIFNNEFEDFWNALAGVKIPMDKVSQGQWAVVQADLNRWDAAILIPSEVQVPGVTGSAIGVEGSGARGTLMIGEAKTRPLWLVFPYASKPVYAGQMLPGYHFFFTMLISPHEKDKLNTTPLINRLIWLCQPGYVIASNSFLTYNNIITGLPPTS